MMIVGRSRSFTPSYYIAKNYVRPVFLPFYQTKYRFLASPDKVIYIDIKEIEGWYRKKIKSGFSFHGIIKGGNWDLHVKKVPLEKRTSYIGIYERFKLGYKWSDTALFRHYQKKFANGNIIKGCRSVPELEKHYLKKYDVLYEDLKSRGILNPNKYAVDPLYVILGRNGEIFWTSNGNHRVSMCRILGIRTIPVYVWMRHKIWQKKRDSVLSGKLNEYRKHPDIISETG